MTVKILTWNIMVDDHNPLRYATIARMIMRANADIICLQEVSVMAWHYIQMEMKRTQYVYHPLAANSSYRTYGEAILFNSENVTCVDKGYFLLPSQQGRSVQWAKFNTIDNHTFKIATGHLESLCCKHSQRQKQWECITGKLACDPDIPTYWLGDCNMLKDEPFSAEGQLYSYGDTYFSERFCEGTESHPYDRVWGNSCPPKLLGRIGYDAKSSLNVSDHDGLMLEFSLS